MKRARRAPRGRSRGERTEYAISSSDGKRPEGRGTTRREGAICANTREPELPHRGGRARQRRGKPRRGRSRCLARSNEPGALRAAPRSPGQTPFGARRGGRRGERRALAASASGGGHAEHLRVRSEDAAERGGRPRTLHGGRSKRGVRDDRGHPVDVGCPARARTWTRGGFGRGSAGRARRRQRAFGAAAPRGLSGRAVTQAARDVVLRAAPQGATRSERPRPDARRRAPGSLPHAAATPRAFGLVGDAAHRLR